jgi:ABC-2 type transport system permease protein
MTALPALHPRHGPRRWLHSYGAMLRLDVAGSRDWLFSFLLVQVLMGAGMAIIYGFYLGDMNTPAATFVATGAPTLSIIPLGMALLPSLVSMHKLEGTYDFVLSLPVPRTVAALSSLTVFTLMSVPGLAVTLLVANWRYDIDLHVSATVVPAVALASLMATSVGYGIGHVIPSPRITNLITNLTILMVLMFSPIAFPIENFPGWLADVHRVLPFWHMANVVRDALTDGLVANVARSYLVLGLWTVGGWAMAGWAVGRRG